jgi:ABC-type transport system substrate-binding protein
MKYHYLAVAVLVAVAVLAAGCTGGGSTGATTTAPTTAARTAVTTAAPAALDTLPPGLALAVSVNRQPYNRDVVVTFNGGSGQGSVTAMQTTIVRSDGTTETQPLTARSGSEVTFKGSSGTDTVSVTATLTNGNTYRFFEQSLP